MPNDDRTETALHSLGDEEKANIAELFYEHIVPKLMRLHARNGMVGCDFAGPRFKRWQIHFRSRGDDFEIVDFEYDEAGCSLDLDI